MCEPMTMALVASTAVSTIGAIQQGQAAKAQGEYQAQVAENNAIIAERNAVMATQQGETEKAQQRLREAQLIGKQRVGSAASGVLVDAGSALTTQADTAYLSDLERQQIDYDTEIEAYNYRTQASNLQAEAGLSRMKGSAAQTASYYSAGSTLLSGGANAGSAWKKYGG